jgi:arylsulfatase A-like enzyme
MYLSSGKVLIMRRWFAIAILYHGLRIAAEVIARFPGHSSRRNVMATLAMAALMSAAIVDCLGAEKPNIVFLLTDDQRWDTLGCYGNTIIETPNIDDLAARGVVFDRNFVSTSICAPNRACILTGQYAARHGMWKFDTPLRSEQLAQTYPALLREAGYRTGFIGKYGVGNPPGKVLFDFDRGFPGQGSFFVELGGRRRHLTSVMADQAEEFLDGCTAEEPFQLSISFKAPHVQDSPSVKSLQFPFDPAPAIANLYRDVQIPLPTTASHDYHNRLPDFLKNSESRARWAIRYWGPGRTQESLKGYYRLISGVDRAVGRIVKKLREKGFAENTVIIFTSDNGQFLGEYGFAGKWYPHEPSIRVPLVVFDPRLAESRRGSRCQAFTLSVDMAPTMLGLAGVEIPEVVQGKSLLPLIQGELPADWRKEIYYEHHFVAPPQWNMYIPRNEGIRTERWKYIQYVDSQPLFEELYDLEVDPDETTNLALLSDYADRLEQFRKQLGEMRASVQ